MPQNSIPFVGDTKLFYQLLPYVDYVMYRECINYLHMPGLGGLTLVINLGTFKGKGVCVGMYTHYAIHIPWNIQH